MKIKNLILFSLLSLSVLFNPLAVLEADSSTNQIKVFIDDEEISFDVAPVISEDRVLVPFRAVVEKLGAKVEWDESERKITVTKGSTEIIIKIGEKSALVDGKTVEIDTEARILDGRTLIPLRFISENLDAYINWDGGQRIVSIYSENKTAQVQPLEEKSFVTDRLFIRVPPGYDEGKSFFSDSKEDRETTLTYTNGDNKYYIEAFETFYYSDGNVAEDAKFVLDLWTRYGSPAYEILEVIESNGRNMAIYTQKEYKSGTLTNIKGAIVKMPDNTLMAVSVSCNASASANMGYAMSFADGIIESITIGTRTLNLPARSEKVGNYNMDIPEDYFVYRERGIDFDVYRFVKIVPAGEESPSMGIYSGMHGGFKKEKYNSSSADTILGKPVTWSFNKSEGSIVIYDGIQTVLYPFDEYWMLHIFIWPETEAQYEEMLKMVQSMSN